MTDRRSLLALAAAGLALPVLPARAQAPAPGSNAGMANPDMANPAEADPRMAERLIGRAEAPVMVIEYFSLTCGHCAAFHRDTWPRVKRELIEAGRVKVIWRDFPLDQTALLAAMIARSLPPERYEAFIGTLFATQDRWAFNRNAEPRRELARLAAVAGMSQEAFEAAATDIALGRAILELRLRAQQEHNVNSTPTFVFGSRTVPGNIPFDRFAALVAETR